MNAKPTNGRKSWLARLMGPDPDPIKNPWLYKTDLFFKSIGISTNGRMAMAILVGIAVLIGLAILTTKLKQWGWL